MTEELAGRRILVVEDEYLIAQDVCRELTQAGAAVIGPVATVGDARRAIEKQPAIDAALLDVALRGELVTPVADDLDERSIPFVFTTGYDPQALPGRYAGRARLEKPVARGKAVACLLQLLAKPPDPL